MTESCQDIVRNIRDIKYSNIIGAVSIEFNGNTPHKLFITTTERHFPILECKQGWMYKLIQMIGVLGVQKLYVVGEKAYSIICSFEKDVILDMGPIYRCYQCGNECIVKMAQFSVKRHVVDETQECIQNIKLEKCN